MYICSNQSIFSRTIIWKSKPQISILVIKNLLLLEKITKKIYNVKNIDYLRNQMDKFAINIRNYSKEQRERIHQYPKVREDRYQG